MLALLLLAAAGFAPSEPVLIGPEPEPEPEPRTPPKPSPLSAACPRCGTEPGQRCNPHTLGRHTYHKARVDALNAGD